MKYAGIKEKYMSEFKCPNCGQMFKVDEGDYANIVQQVRNDEFQKELARREKEMAQRRDAELNVVKMEQERTHQAALSKKDSDIAEKEREIAALRAQIQANETAKKLAVTEAVQSQERESAKVTQKELAKRDAEIAAREREIAE